MTYICDHAGSTKDAAAVTEHPTEAEAEAHARALTLRGAHHVVVYEAPAVEA